MIGCVLRRVAPVLVPTAVAAGATVATPQCIKADGGCFSYRSQAVTTYSTPAYSYNYAYYFVGRPIREKALVQKAVEDDPLWQEFQEFKRWRETQSQRPPVMEQQTGVLQDTCLKCHSGDEPKGGLDMTGELDAGTKLQMMTKVWRGEMPPNAPLPDDQAAELFNQLLGEGE